MATSTVMAPREAYATWADAYPPSAHNPLMRTEQLVVEPLILSRRPRRALDVGTGSGRYLPILASAGAASIVGLDFSWEMLRRGASQPGGRVCADARTLPFRPAQFDLVNASLMAGDISDLSSWATELARVLEPGGHLVYSDFHPSWVAHGWRRTFETTRGDRIEIPFEPHSIHDHVTAMEHAGLHLLACYELPLAAGTRESDAFRRRWGNPPVLVILLAKKS